MCLSTSFILLSIFALLTGFLVSPALGADEYESLRARYTTLRNTDIEVRRPAEWEALAAGFERYAERNRSAEHAPSGIYHAALLHEVLYRTFQDRAHLRRSTELLERLVKRYPAHPLADDALVRRGEIFLAAGDESGARASFREVLEAYAGSDMAYLAEARMALLAGEGRASAAPPPQVKEDPREGKKPARIAAGDRRPLIVIDPGHGGEDFGAMGQGGLLEKDVTLAVALDLERLLREELGALVKLTRRTDAFVPLAARTSLANDFEADLFISLHANASPKGKLSGVETFYLDNRGDKASRALAERENASVRFEGPEADLQYMLSDLIQAGKLEHSVRLASLTQESLVGTLNKRWPGVKALGVKRAPFYVLVGAHMPCVLVEMSFIDNEDEGKRMADPEYRRALALGISDGIRRFLEEG